MLPPSLFPLLLLLLLLLLHARDRGRGDSGREPERQRDLDRDREADEDDLEDLDPLLDAEPGLSLMLASILLACLRTSSHISFREPQWSSESDRFRPLRIEFCSAI